MRCLDENQILGYRDGSLGADAIEHVEAHLDRCAMCRRVLSALARIADSQPTIASDLPPTIWLNRTLNDRYRILERCGSGGSGEVFVAEHLTTGRRCAVKVLSAVDDSQALERFEREARILGSLRHPGIVGIHDFARTEDDHPYLVMDFLEGEDLATRLRRDGALAWQQARELFRQLAAALSAAHARGVLHRDLKPSNVMVVPESDGTERAIVLDFGLGKIAADSVDLTQTGMVMGTPAYMSPEQARGETVDERTDVYGLATILLQMVTGKAPFEGSSFTEVLARVLSAPAPVASASSLPSHARAALTMALAKDPSARYRSIDAFGDALLAPRPRRRAATLWIGAAFVAATLATVAVVSLRVSGRDDDEITSQVDSAGAKVEAASVAKVANVAPLADAGPAIAVVPDATPASRPPPVSRHAPKPPTGKRRSTPRRGSPRPKPVLTNSMPPGLATELEMNQLMVAHDYRGCVELGKRDASTKLGKALLIACLRQMGAAQSKGTYNRLLRSSCQDWLKRYGTDPHLGVAFGCKHLLVQP